MARIRTIKPELAAHEGLYDLEKATGLPIRFAWAMLFTVADREGRFVWRPRTLKVQILPHDDLDFARVLEAFEGGGYVVRYTVDGETYGYIPTWAKHQSINLREAQSTIPEPPARASTCTVDTTVDAAGTCMHVHAPGERKEGKEGVDVELHSTVPDVPRETSPAESDPLARLRIEIPEQPPNPEPPRNGQPNRTDQATEVFEFWRETMRKPRAQFTPERVKLVTARLRDGYTPADLKKAVFGCSVTPHNAGHNDRDQRFDDLALICRDGGHVDRFMGNADRPPALEPRR